jgi:hypothetical protein
VHRRPFLRAIAIFLLTWIAVDLVAIDTCVLDVDAEVAGDLGSAVAFRAPGPAHVPTALHPDNCLCHGHSLAPDASSGLAEPPLNATTIADEAAARTRGSASALYHPPQLNGLSLVSHQM